MKHCKECGLPTNRAEQAIRCFPCAQKEKIHNRSNWNRRNPEVIGAAVRKWDHANPERRAWYRRVYKQSVRPHCPPWVDRKTLKIIYDNCPSGMEVDHIMPLKGRNFCGLHVPWNLQYLSPKDNKRASNRLKEVL